MIRQDVHTEGGTYVEGNLQVAGDYVGRDQYVGYTYEQVIALVDHIRTTGRSRRWDGRMPYVGLVPFEQADAMLFAGREQLSHTLIDALGQSRFVAVAGASGSGKSSLVRAGVLSALTRGVLPSSDKWLIETFTPRTHPIEQLTLAMSALASRAGLSSAEGNAIRETGQNDRQALTRVADLIARGPRDQRVVLFIDQFEELFTQTQAEQERLAFVKLIATRSDFLDPCTQYTDIRDLMNARLHFVGAMDRQELARAIAFPALEVGIEIDPALVEEIIADTRGETGALPLVQFALRDLFESMPHNSGDAIALTREAYLGQGGIGQALQRHAGEVFARFSSAQAEVARAIFLRLVNPGTGVHPVPSRRRAAEDELTGLTAANAATAANIDVAPVIEALA